MPWQSPSRCAATKSPSGSASAARSIPKTRPTSIPLIANADAALFRAKADGRYMVVFEARDGPAPARTLGVAARHALGDRARRIYHALSAASQDRRRDVRV